ncbi:Wzz/FepE/Etk N-terminal domain-containing protein, partial [Rhizobium johnstonii]|uniref:Wzz/FepE/Etk N-terminal domain-containing protein n=1 Tax=Rhizobium johnstonii TaxID=3019933 RepID=UPI003F980C0A
MNQYDRNRVSRLPGWRSFEPSQTAPEGVRVRSPVIRPDDFVRPSPDPAPPSFVPPASIAETRQYEPPAPPPPKPPVVDAPPNAEPAPLLDLRSSIAAIWSRRLIVFGLALLGALAGGAVAPLIAQKFTAVSSLYFDPRQIGLADASAQSSGPSPEMISALIDSQVQILTSGNVLRRVAEAMKLDQDPEFTGGRTDGAAAVGTLQKALVITREASTYVVSLAATTNDPEKSARLANQVVTSFTEEENSASNGIYENTSSTRRLATASARAFAWMVFSCAVTK